MVTHLIGGLGVTYTDFPVHRPAVRTCPAWASLSMSFWNEMYSTTPTFNYVSVVRRGGHRPASIMLPTRSGNPDHTHEYESTVLRSRDVDVILAHRYV